MFSLNSLVWVGDKPFIIILVISTRPLLYRLESFNGKGGLTLTFAQLQEQQS